ncbi:SEC-C metal-binding domain-containing protein [Alkaliphilus hydrothermalis]|uniref:Preprotein translocase subunit SecA n=1 Tax=Alkaliphilus hydrothermalis TaxID=1482730 RepID=A0ABS2NQ11_9FIRM|nr:SEC-C metal-binding domain-containing protein [Alkaliphilus hydrothermalis]MBM7614982.1 preprotein translocase subunit SecA [Alkaliphilus hydrothermalis]
MSLYEQWKNIAFEETDQEKVNQFWNEYCEIEKGFYESILGKKQDKITGTLKDLAKEYGVTNVYFVGFLDGINDSLVEAIELEGLNEDSEIDIQIDFEKLYFNMLAVKADWLYTLPQWEDIYTEEKRKEIKKEYNATKTVVKDDKIGRNDPCTCGSGKKYKKCCGK